MFHQDYDFLNDASDNEEDHDFGNDSSDDDDLKRVLRQIGGIEEEMDFEACMAQELSDTVRIIEAVRGGGQGTAMAAVMPPAEGVVSVRQKSNEEAPSKADSGEPEAATRKAKNVRFEEKAPTFYDDAYFDSDDETSNGGQKPGEQRLNGKHPVLSNDELFYDPRADDEDQAWVDGERQKHLPRGFSPRKPFAAKSRKRKEKGVPTSDAVLDCPACMTTVCIDCQRHEKYHQQYRAMFVKNCSVDTAQNLRYKSKKYSHKRRRIDDDESAEQECEEDVFHPVKCTECGTEVGVIGIKEEVYHFFNVLASHA